MSVIKQLRSASWGRSSTESGVSGELREKLGEELAAMFSKVGRRIYKAATEQTERAISQSILDNRGVIASALAQEFGRRGRNNARKILASMLDEIIGEALTDVAENVYGDLDDIAQAILDTTEAQGEDEDEMMDEDMEDEDMEMEDDEDEGMEMDEDEDMEEGDAQDLEAIADELEAIKASALAQAARLANAGQYDAAAALKTAVDKF